MAGNTEEAKIASFWNEISESLGEQVLSHTMGRYIEENSRAEPLWGLLYLTATRLFFRHMPQTGWFAALISRLAKPDTEVVIEVPLDGAQLREPERRGPLKRLFVKGDDVWTLLLPDGRRFSFTIDHATLEFAAALRARTDPATDAG